MEELLFSAYYGQSLHNLIREGLPTNRQPAGIVCVKCSSGFDNGVHRRRSRYRQHCAADDPRLQRLPRELYQVQYPAPGDPALAALVQQLLAPLPVRRDDTQGLDHGTWSVLLHLYPQADITLVQLSIDETQPPSFHYDIGRRLAHLREERILILGSGNIVHNLNAYAWGRRAPEPYDWAISFESRVREMLLAGEYKPLINYEHQLGTEAERPFQRLIITSFALCCGHPRAF